LGVVWRILFQKKPCYPLFIGKTMPWDGPLVSVVLSISQHPDLHQLLHLLFLHLSRDKVRFITIDDIQSGLYSIPVVFQPKSDAL